MSAAHTDSRGHRRSSTYGSGSGLSEVTASSSSSGKSCDQALKNGHAAEVTEWVSSSERVRSLVSAHSASLAHLARARNALDAFLDAAPAEGVAPAAQSQSQSQSRRKNWNQVNAHYVDAVRSTAHIRLWTGAAYTHENDSVNNDPHLTLGDAVLPQWHALEFVTVFARPARLRKREQTASVARAILENIIEKQTQMLQYVRAHAQKLPSSYIHKSKSF